MMEDFVARGDLYVKQACSLASVALTSAPVSIELGRPFEGEHWNANVSL